jgi:hypothetical protein
MYGVQPSFDDSVIDRMPRHPQLEQLAPRHHAVLAVNESPDRLKDSPGHHRVKPSADENSPPPVP